MFRLTLIYLFLPFTSPVFCEKCFQNEPNEEILLDSCFSNDINTFHMRLILITPPKCGSYLACWVLSLLTNKGFSQHTDYYLENLRDFFHTLDHLARFNQFMLTHIPADPRVLDELTKQKYKVISMIRDPRDQLISSLHWILSGKDSDHLFDIPVSLFEKMNITEQIDELITGSKFGFQVFDALYKRMYGWFELDPSFIFVLRYEDIVGPKGGGSSEKQRAAIKKLAQFLNVTISDERMIEIEKSLAYWKGPTFRNGKINEWKTVFTEDQKKLFDQMYENDLHYLGYPLYK